MENLHGEDARRVGVREKGEHDMSGEEGREEDK